VILVGEMRDRETIEIAMEAAETGHLVMSTLHTIDASKTVERIVGVFPLAEQHAIRNRLGKSFRYIVSQRLIPRKEGGRVAAIEILKSTLRTREYVEKGEGEGKTLLDAMRVGQAEGMQHFDGEIEKLIRAGPSISKPASATPRILEIFVWNSPILPLPQQPQRQRRPRDSLSGFRTLKRNFAPLHFSAIW